MGPTRKFIMQNYPNFHDTVILCTPDGRAVTTLSAPRIRHLYKLFRPNLTHRIFDDDVDLLIKRLGSRSEIRSPTPATTTRNRWATREDPLSALHNTFQTHAEL
jgi:hypothetical protein